MSEEQPVDLVSLARAARERLPGLVQQIEDIARSCDPIELLAQLTLLYQTHPADKQPNRDESTEWQVRIEWLARLVFAREMASPLTPEIIDARILVPLEALLDDYFGAMSITLMEPAPGLSKEQDDIRSNLQIEALHVRGQGFQIKLELLAVELYSPHERWCLAKLRLTVQDAFVLAKAVAARFDQKVHETRELADEIRIRVEGNPAVALEIEGLPQAIRAGLEESVSVQDSEQFARGLRCLAVIAIEENYRIRAGRTPRPSRGQDRSRASRGVSRLHFDIVEEHPWRAGPITTLCARRDFTRSTTTHCRSAPILAGPSAVTPPGCD